jgi:hypothetical protein
MSELGIYEGCYVELRNGDVVGPVKIRPYNRERAPSAFYDDRICEWNPRGQWTDGDENHPKNIIRAVSKEAVKLAVSKEYGEFTKPKATIPPHVLSAAMGAGIKAEPAYEQFVSAILEAGFKAQYGIEFVGVAEKPAASPVTHSEIKSVLMTPFTGRGRKVVGAEWEYVDVKADEIMRLLESKSKNESEDRIQDSEKAKGGLSGLTTLRTMDSVHPITAAFLKFLYPDAPLRAVEFDGGTLTASYGLPMYTVAEIEVKVSEPGKIPMWVEDGGEAPTPPPFRIAPDLIAIALDEAERKFRKTTIAKQDLRTLQIKEIHHLINAEVHRWGPTEAVKLVAPEGWYLDRCTHEHQPHRFANQTVEPMPHKAGSWVVHFQYRKAGGRLTGARGHNLVEAWQNAVEAVRQFELDYALDL